MDGVHRHRPLDIILSQKHPALSPTPCRLKIHFSIILSRLGLLRSFRAKFLYAFLLFTICATCPEQSLSLIESP
jgi:hypothetical protein